MSLNIKNEEANRLVSEVVQLTGESKTQAIVVALRQRLEREKRLREQNHLSDELMAIGEKCTSYEVIDARPHGELLYDENGLPK